MGLRIGFGIDFHQLVEGRALVIGGVTIPHHKGSLGHSDADVLLHAICDALLGAAKLGDIGTQFPDTAAEFKDIDSKILLRRTAGLLKQHGFGIVNIDSTVCAQRPKLKPYIPQMEETLSQVLEIEAGQVSIKATTTEKLGFEGREEGISAHAVVLINKN